MVSATFVALLAVSAGVLAHGPDANVNQGNSKATSTVTHYLRHVAAVQVLEPVNPVAAVKRATEDKAAGAVLESTTTKSPLLDTTIDDEDDCPAEDTESAMATPTTKGPATQHSETTTSSATIPITSKGSVQESTTNDDEDDCPAEDIESAMATPTIKVPATQHSETTASSVTMPITTKGSIPPTPDNEDDCPAEDIESAMATPTMKVPATQHSETTTSSVTMPITTKGSVPPTPDNEDDCPAEDIEGTMTTSTTASTSVPSMKPVEATASSIYITRTVTTKGPVPSTANDEDDCSVEDNEGTIITSARGIVPNTKPVETTTPCSVSISATTTSAQVPAGPKGTGLAPICDPLDADAPCGTSPPGHVEPGSNGQDSGSGGDNNGQDAALPVCTSASPGTPCRPQDAGNSEPSGKNRPACLSSSATRRPPDRFAGLKTSAARSQTMPAAPSPAVKANNPGSSSSATRLPRDRFVDVKTPSAPSPSPAARSRNMKLVLSSTAPLLRARVVQSKTLSVPTLTVQAVW